MRKTKETQAQRIAILEKVAGVMYNRQIEILKRLKELEDKTIIE